MTRGIGAPKRVQGDSVTAYERVPLDDYWMQEHRLQKLLDKHPDLVPVNEFGSAWGPLVSLGREIQVSAGSIDNLFVSPTGELTLVETKLWRNPEARRVVVAQILDYAAALSRLSYDELDKRVKRQEGGQSIRQRVEIAYTDRADDEARFIDTVARNLGSGSMLLLIIGDGIREDLEDIAGLLQRDPGLRFQVGLVELRFYRSPGSTNDHLVVPQVVGRSREIARTVIEVIGDRRDEFGVIVVTSDGESTSGSDRLGSIDEFVRRTAELIGRQRAEALRDLAKWWETKRRQPIELKQDSITLRGRFDPESNRTVSVMNLNVSGRLMGSVQPMANTQAILDPTEAAQRFGDAGFTGNANWPTKEPDLSDSAEMNRCRELLDWIGDSLDEARAEAAS